MESVSKKDIAKIVAAGAVILVCIFLVVNMYMSSQQHVVHQINLPVGSSEKMQSMKNGGGDSPSDNIDPSKMKRQ